MSKSLKISYSIGIVRRGNLFLVFLGFNLETNYSMTLAGSPLFQTSGQKRVYYQVMTVTKVFWLSLNEFSSIMESLQFYLVQ